ncbi:MAG: hypothetical protein ACKVJQ_09735 [Alphaproteobacteria bacterium]
MVAINKLISDGCRSPRTTSAAVGASKVTSREGVSLSSPNAPCGRETSER